MSGKYAQGTEVSIGRSRDELERLLRGRGATGFIAGWEEGRDHHVVAFRIAERLIRLTVPRSWFDQHKRTPTGRARTDEAAQREADSEERRR